MWVATALILIAGVPTPMADKRGPYQTEEACEARIDEMRHFTVNHPAFEFVSGDCKQDGIGA